MILWLHNVQRRIWREYSRRTHVQQYLKIRRKLVRKWDDSVNELPLEKCWDGTRTVQPQVMETICLFIFQKYTKGVFNLHAAWHSANTAPTIIRSCKTEKDTPEIYHKQKQYRSFSWVFTNKSMTNIRKKLQHSRVDMKLVLDIVNNI